MVSFQVVGLVELKTSHDGGTVLRPVGQIQAFKLVVDAALRGPRHVRDFKEANTDEANLGNARGSEIELHAAGIGDAS